jgi:hypothetical protein
MRVEQQLNHSNNASGINLRKNPVIIAKQLCMFIELVYKGVYNRTKIPQIPNKHTPIIVYFLFGHLMAMYCSYTTINGQTKEVCIQVLS